MVIRHPNHDCVRTLKSVHACQGTGTTPGRYSIASPKHQQLSAYKASRVTEHKDGGDDKDDVSDGNGSVSGTDFGSLTSVE